MPHGNPHGGAGASSRAATAAGSAAGTSSAAATESKLQARVTEQRKAGQRHQPATEKHVANHQRQTPAPAEKGAHYHGALEPMALKCQDV